MKFKPGDILMHAYRLDDYIHRIIRIDTLDKGDDVYWFTPLSGLYASPNRYLRSYIESTYKLMTLEDQVLLKLEGVI